MELFLDNDIIIKLSSINYLQQIESIFNINSNSIYILDSAEFYLKKSSKIRKNYPPEIIEKALSDINSYNKIPDSYVDFHKSKMIYENISNKKDMDSGELVLFSLTPSSNAYLIATGDKRAIIMLNQISEIVLYLNHKIVCLEYVLYKFTTSDFEGLLNSIPPDFHYDKVIEVIFKQQNITKEKVLEGLLSYYTNLKAQSGSLLLEL